MIFQNGAVYYRSAVSADTGTQKVRDRWFKAYELHCLKRPFAQVVVVFQALHLDLHSIKDFRTASLFCFPTHGSLQLFF